MVKSKIFSVDYSDPIRFLEEAINRFFENNDFIYLDSKIVDYGATQHRIGVIIFYDE